ncbi:MAG: SGNH/GDSL hydrolase family protein [Ruminococcus sp.]|uniref:SGNH/GDSL hydrolase family protein n=1 Tax=Ruminococcus sp. TaxID=41978 RepID=UPI0025D19235|nr:SGNH/GDSL hydrolase family protein [Ruminococcus sp.]MBR5684222.1 SGNH/GDSL hydrolase family protein [Ruminococcus sp.]
MKKAAAFLGAAAMVLSLVSCKMTVTPKKEVVHNTEVPPKMMFLGDSVAAGYGLEGYSADDLYHCRSYANILKEKYEAELEGECGHEMVNKAVSGATSADLLALIQSGSLDEDLIDSDAVVISIGGNDMLEIMLNALKNMGITENGDFKAKDIDVFSAASSLLNMDKDVDEALVQFEKNIRTISEELSERTDGTVFVQTLYDPLESLSKFHMITDFSNEKIGKLNSMISENSLYGYKVIDVAADFKGKSDTLTNIGKFDIHPNAEGHRQIADDVDAAFRAAGFSYTTIEYGKKELTVYWKRAIYGGCAGLIALTAVIIGVVVHKKKKKKD